MTAESVSRIAARAKAPPSTQALSDAICFNAAREQVLGREAANCYRKLEEIASSQDRGSGLLHGTAEGLRSRL